MYVTRFAPTPSGPLHFGSLITLTGAYLRARSQKGRFLIRIEDLDTDRCPKANTETVLHQIEVLGFDHDGDILYQSQNIARYEQRLKELRENGLTFNCYCSREMLRKRPCNCLDTKLPSSNIYSVRLSICDYVDKGFSDLLQGFVNFRGYSSYGEQYMILKRRDGIFSYNFACVTDDIDSGITEVVRGRDLIDVTVPQIALYKAFNAPCPKFMHLPLALTADGRKLSKQNKASSVTDTMSPQEALKKALQFLGQDTDFIRNGMSCEAILHTASLNFCIEKIPLHSAVY